MTKQDLIESMAAASGCTKACAGKALDGAIKTITKAVKKGDTRSPSLVLAPFPSPRGRQGLAGTRGQGRA
jgi:Bacterial DNA-binding protein